MEFCAKVVIAVIALGIGTGHAVAKPPGRTLPFTREEDADGARFVWFVCGQAGLAYQYVPAREFPRSSSWGEVELQHARAGGVAWWPNFVAIYDPNGEGGADLMTAPGALRLADQEKKRGPAKFYRLRVARQ